MIPLGDVRWLTLAQSERDGRYLVQWLRRLYEEPDNTSLFSEESHLLCSEEITWSPAFATAPHLIKIAQRSQTRARIHYVSFLGNLAIYRVPDEHVEASTRCPPDLEKDFAESMTAARDIAIALLPSAAEEENVRRLLAAIAAFQGLAAWRSKSMTSSWDNSERSAYRKRSSSDSATLRCRHFRTDNLSWCDLSGRNRESPWRRSNLCRHSWAAGESHGWRCGSRTRWMKTWNATSSSTEGGGRPHVHLRLRNHELRRAGTSRGRPFLEWTAGTATMRYGPCFRSRQSGHRSATSFAA